MLFLYTVSIDFYNVCYISSCETWTFFLKNKSPLDLCLSAKLLTVEELVTVFSNLVVNKQLDGVVPPLDQHQFISLSGCRVRKRRSQSGPHPSLHPKTQSESKDLLQQRPLHASVHIVGPHGETDLEGIQALGVLPYRTCLRQVHLQSL